MLSLNLYYYLLSDRSISDKSRAFIYELCQTKRTNIGIIANIKFSLCIDIITFLEPSLILFKMCLYSEQTHVEYDCMNAHTISIFAVYRGCKIPFLVARSNYLYADVCFYYIIFIGLKT